MCANLGQALSYREPPQFRVIDVVTENQFIRVDNSRKVIEVRAADTLELLWEIEVRRFYKWDYEVHLSRDGKYLFYFMPSVSRVKSTFLEVYSRDGLVTQYKVGEVVDSLHEVDTPCGGCPTHYWRERRISVRDDHIQIYPVDGGYANLWASEHKVLRGFYEDEMIEKSRRIPPKSPRH